MTDEAEFKEVQRLEVLARHRQQARAQAVFDQFIFDLSFDPDGDIDEASKAIDAWGQRMDKAIFSNLDSETIAAFAKLLIDNREKVQMSALARERHAEGNVARDWVQQQWRNQTGEYDSKVDFAKTYVMLLGEKFPRLKKIASRTISEKWLSGL